MSMHPEISKGKKKKILKTHCTALDSFGNIFKIHKIAAIMYLKYHKHLNLFQTLLLDI